jgi:glutamate-ammonia-ligase adenylyltransferase
VLATGRLGAGEMGYDSDVELLYVYDVQPQDVPDTAREFFVRAGGALSRALGEEGRDGHLYRVRRPAWPQTTCSLAEYAHHYAASRNVAEKCSLTRARVIAGDADLGRRFIACCEAFVYGEHLGAREQAPSASPAEHIERFTQHLQMRSGSAHHALRQTGTLASLEAGSLVGAIDEAVRRDLDHAYVILRSAEHRLQLGVKEALDKQLALARARVEEICGRQ